MAHKGLCVVKHQTNKQTWFSVGDVAKHTARGNIAWNREVTSEFQVILHGFNGPKWQEMHSIHLS